MSTVREREVMQLKLPEPTVLVLDRRERPAEIRLADLQTQAVA